MRRQHVDSELIASIGWKNGDMEVRYTDSVIFIYSRVPFTTFSALKRSAHPGRDWLAIRSQYKFKQVS